MSIGLLILKISSPVPFLTIRAIRVPKVRPGPREPVFLDCVIVRMFALKSTTEADTSLVFSLNSHCCCLPTSTLR